MQKMVKFRLSRECREIAVNPARVLYVCHYEHGVSTLHFGKDCFVRVQGTLAEVSSILDGAMSETEALPRVAAPEPRQGVN